MTESTQHREMVRYMAKWVRRRYAHKYGFDVLTDLPADPGAPRPDRIGRYRPDLSAQDAPLTVRIVGEAKTRNGLRGAAARNQIAAFIGYLRMTPAETLFILCVPTPSTAEALAFARDRRRDAGTVVPVCVLNESEAILVGAESWR